MVASTGDAAAHVLFSKQTSVSTLRTAMSMLQHACPCCWNLVSARPCLCAVHTNSLHAPYMARMVVHVQFVLRRIVMRPGIIAALVTIIGISAQHGSALTFSGKPWGSKRQLRRD